MNTPRGAGHQTRGGHAITWPPQTRAKHNYITFRWSLFQIQILPKHHLARWWIGLIIEWVDYAWRLCRWLIRYWRVLSMDSEMHYRNVWLRKYWFPRETGWRCMPPHTRHTYASPLYIFRLMVKLNQRNPISDLIPLDTRLRDGQSQHTVEHSRSHVRYISIVRFLFSFSSAPLLHVRLFCCISSLKGNLYVLFSFFFFCIHSAEGQRRILKDE